MMPTLRDIIALDRKREEARAVACPSCSAAPGKACRENGAWMERVHVMRFEAARVEAPKREDAR